MQRLLTHLIFFLMGATGVMAAAGTGANDEAYQAAVNLIKARQFGPARVLLRQVLAKAPADLQVIYALAFAAEGDGDAEVARNYARKWLHLYHTQAPPESQLVRDMAERISELLRRVSPASALVLARAQALAAMAANATNELERQQLLRASAAIMPYAVGDFELDLGSRTVLMRHDQPELKGVLRYSPANLAKERAQLEKALGYKLREAPPDAILNKANGHWYKYFDDTLSWDDAQSKCRDQGGYLATITSKEENAFVWEALVKNRRAWLGAHDRVANNTWQWLTGEPFTYTNWDARQPDNSNNEDALEFFWGKPGTWNDNKGPSLQRGLLCEW